MSVTATLHIGARVFLTRLPASNVAFIFIGNGIVPRKASVENDADTHSLCVQLTSKATAASIGRKHPAAQQLQSFVTQSNTLPEYQTFV